MLGVRVHVGCEKKSMNLKNIRATPDWAFFFLQHALVCFDDRLRRAREPVRTSVDVRWCAVDGASPPPPPLVPRPNF